MDMNERKRWIQARDLADFRVFSCGYYAKARTHKWKRKGLDEGIYIYCVAGKGYYREQNKIWNIGPGDLLYCFPKSSHMYNADPGDPWTIYWMHISGKRILRFSKYLGLTRNQPVISIGINREIINLFHSMFALFRVSPDSTHMFAIQTCAMNILGQMAILPHDVSKKTKYSRQIESILTFMERSTARQLKVSDLAEHVGLSPFHFSRIFSIHTGLSPMAYFTKLRIHNACQFLADSKLTIKEIAYQLGFSDQYYFSRCFKRIMGFSPSNYRSTFSGVASDINNQLHNN